MSFDRFIRFIDENDSVLYGNLEEPLSSHAIIGSEVKVLSGTPEDGFLKTEKKATVAKVCLSIHNKSEMCLCVKLANCESFSIP